MEIINILVVDDDQDIREYLALCFRMSDYQVATAQNGVEALAMLEKFMPELIVCDVMMPGMDGYQFCRELRARGFDSIPFIFCSALGAPRERVKGLKLGADDYLVKPVDCEEINLKVDALLKRSRKLNELVTCFDDLKNGGIIRGVLGEVTVPFVLQMLNYYGPGEICLQVQTGDDRVGQIYLKDKEVIHAETEKFTGKRAFQRILSWEDGDYRVDKKVWLLDPTMSGGLEEYLLDALAQMDECRQLRSVLEKKGKAFAMVNRPELSVSQYDENRTKVLSLIEKYRELDKIIDHSRLTDLETLRIISDLLSQGVVRAIRETERT